MEKWTNYLIIASITFGLISAVSWFHASFVKVSHEKAMALREKEANKKGEKPNYASASLGDWDMSATFAAQSKSNAVGAFFAALSILLQAVVQLIS
jgi:hypothetical protein